MTLSEFLQDVTEEMEENDWGDKELEFCTLDRSGLDYLSIYEADDDKITIDVGTGEDCNTRNEVLDKKER